MAKITKDNYNELKSKDLDNNYAKVWHVNALYDALNSGGNYQSKFTVDTVTQTGGPGNGVTINADAGSITLAGTVGGGQFNFVVTNDKVTDSSIILLTFKLNSAFDAPTTAFGISTYSITDGSFGITFARPASPTPSAIPLTIDFLIINP
jgi:hypothetical protein